MEGKLSIYFGLATSMAAFSLIAVGFILVFTRYHRRILNNQRMIHEMNLKHQKDLISTNIKSSEEERIRLAKDIHDELGGIFSALSISLIHLGQVDKTASVTEKISQAKKLVLSGTESVRRISHAIVPFDLELFGLQTAIEKHLDRVSVVSDININFKNDGDLSSLNNDTALSIFRVLQELISNTLKYAEATEIHLRFKQNHSTEMLYMSYSDNGKGMDTTIKPKVTGIGLKNIESRAISLKADLNIISSPGKGMKCTLAIPIKNPVYL